MISNGEYLHFWMNHLLPVPRNAAFNVGVHIHDEKAPIRRGAARYWERRRLRHQRKNKHKNKPGMFLKDLLFGTPNA